MKYRVHLYPIFRCPVEVEAGNMNEAIDLAYQRAAPFDGKFEEFEWAEDIDGFLVDIVGDEEYTHSCWFDKHGEPQDQVTEDITYWREKYLALRDSLYRQRTQYEALRTRLGALRTQLGGLRGALE